jgi:hypothetical protein
VLGAVDHDPDACDDAVVLLAAVEDVDLVVLEREERLKEAELPAASNS